MNLFVRVPQLGLPASIAEYLLYNVSLDTEYKDDDDDDDNDDDDDDSIHGNIDIHDGASIVEYQF